MFFEIIKVVLKFFKFSLLLQPALHSTLSVLNKTAKNEREYKKRFKSYLLSLFWESSSSRSFSESLLSSTLSYLFLRLPRTFDESSSSDEELAETSRFLRLDFSARLHAGFLPAFLGPEAFAVSGVFPLAESVDSDSVVIFLDLLPRLFSLDREFAAGSSS